MPIIQCKYCGTDILNAQPRQEMCDVCRRLHLLEYDRIRNGIERKRNILELFEFHKCVICHKHIEWGTDVCSDCRKKRDIIRERLLEEFKQSIKTQQDGNTNTTTS